MFSVERDGIGLSSELALFDMKDIVSAWIDSKADALSDKMLSKRETVIVGSVANALDSVIVEW